MKFTLSWLKDHLETTAEAGRLAEALTALGLEVESLSDRSAALAPFTVASVVSAEPHPDADKLRVCRVDTGTDTVQVVCGAPNARAGIKVVFARPGTVIPATGVVLKTGVIRGVESRGMMCSEREMGLSEAHDGIIELPPEAPVGQPFAPVLGLDQALIDINLTPDRADCAGVRGVARDLQAAGLGRLKPLDATPVPGRFRSPITVGLDFPEGETAACPVFVGRLIRGLVNGQSPRWLQDRLTAIGLRPISALVDITNYITHDLGRPLHVFDAARITGGLTVRPARAGEGLKALNGRDYVLNEGETVVADEAGVLSLAGIMGGSASGCTGATTAVFLEVALFDPRRTAVTGRRHGIDSDARYRFERGVDPGMVLPGAEIATRMILELCGGEASELVVAGAVPESRRRIVLRPGRVAALGGLAVEPARQRQILEGLGFAVEAGGDGDGGLVVTVPSWRGDVEGEADLVEEVLRVVGYDAIPVVPMTRTVTVTRPALTPAQRRPGLARRALAARGLNEAVTFSFVSAAEAALFGGTPAGLALLNPISADLDRMRPSLLGGLVRAAARNADRGHGDLGLFEVGPAYRSAEPDGQDLVAAALRAGTAVPRHWAGPSRAVDVFDAKADALAVLEVLGVAVTSLQVTTDAPAWYHPGRSGVLRLGPVVLARFGMIHPAVLEALAAKAPMAGIEVFVAAVPAPRRKAGTARPLLVLPPFQPVSRDFAFVVDKSVPADKLVRAARGADKVLIVDAGVFDVYEGPGVPEGRRSLALSVTLQPREASLTEAEIEAISSKVVTSVIKATGAILRQ